jgi:alpha-1,4-digalacturonate transport system permease protein
MQGKKSSSIKKIAVTAIAVLISAIFLFPIIWLAMSSFKPSSELFKYPLNFFPEQFTVEHYVNVVKKGFLQYVYNSFNVAIVATLITLFINSMCGYAFAIYRHEIKSANKIFGIFLLGTLVPGEAIMIPQFDVILKAGLYNNFWGIVLPTVTTTTGIFMYRQFFMSTPMALAESARIDGAGEWTIFRKIMFPLAKSTTVTLAIFSFMWRWNDYILPLLVLSDQKKYTIQVAIKNYIAPTGVDWNSIISASIISIIPVLIIFIILQKHIIGGIATSGMKN